MGSPSDGPHGTRVGRRAASMALAVLLASALGACTSPANEEAAGGTRPDVATWTVTWDATRAIVPHLDDLSVPPDDQVCDATVVELRTSREDLFPTPDELVDVEVENWLEHAISIFFECFQSDIGAQTVTQGYEELGRLAAEVDTALDTVT